MLSSKNPIFFDVFLEKGKEPFVSQYQFLFLHLYLL